MGVDTKKVVLAVGLATFTGVALYLLYKKNDEDDELEMYAADTATSRHTLIEMVIPRNAVGFVIGRQGANVKEIQEITNTRINFKDPGGPTDDRVCVIRGKAENAQEAERLIQRAIAEQPKLLTINISVPQRACGRIIGRNGDSIREMCAVSGAKIIVDREFRTPVDGMRLITIKGTEDQLSTAKQLIQTKVEEEEAMQRRIELSAANRAPRTKHKPDAGKSQVGDIQNPALNTNRAPRTKHKPDAGKSQVGDIQNPALNTNRAPRTKHKPDAGKSQVGDIQNPALNTNRAPRTKHKPDAGKSQVGDIQNPALNTNRAPRTKHKPDAGKSQVGDIQNPALNTNRAPRTKHKPDAGKSQVGDIQNPALNTNRAPRTKHKPDAGKSQVGDIQNPALNTNRAPRTKHKPDAGKSQVGDIQNPALNTNRAPRTKHKPDAGKSQVGDIQNPALNTNRAPRTKHKPDAGKSQGAGDQPLPTRESLVATGADGYLEVYVSAVDTPGHFWVQVKSPRAIELDKAGGEDDGVLFGGEQPQHVQTEKARGTAPRWPKLAENDSDPDQTALTVYYVDFGDTDTVQRRQAAELRTDFLGLSHQAVECFLSGVKPSGCSWTDAAGDCFEELTYAAQWKSVMAKVVRYQQAGSRKVPVVELVDTNSELDVDVAKELVKRGHAVWAKSGATGSREASPACCS
ncbi:Tudor and KH domain-containing protein [Amphibalanus amphitrite]|uniref:Tudor and KH domain-containing protein n=1 Tax=Amphibalanus amphitrite TaxID=1232801 RepID=A0A6A4W2N1_AMPAM|nr:Tudor and KH domain-containing protein [Amphibalanus amphitrite]